MLSCSLEFCSEFSSRLCFNYSVYVAEVQICFLNVIPLFLSFRPTFPGLIHLEVPVGSLRFIMSKPNSFLLYQPKHAIAFLKFIVVTVICYTVVWGRKLYNLFLHFSYLFGIQVVWIDYNSAMSLEVVYLYFILTYFIGGSHGLSLALKKVNY